MPNWAIPFIGITVLLAIVFAAAWFLHERKLRRLGASRPPMSRDEFMAMMQPEVSEEASAFMWEKALFYVKPHATPYPDDDLMRDLPIDHEDITLDWPEDWCNQQGVSVDALPEWPQGQTVTVRNFGRWLDSVVAR